MQSTNIPTKIPLPFAYAAGVGYIEPIPSDSQIGVTAGKASLHDGFPPLTFTPLGSGGIPPWGADFNGILNEITSITQWQQAGGFFPYDSAFSTSVGGYPKGAVIQSTSFNGFWASTTENNTTNPDTGGAGWVATAFQGLKSLAMSSTSVTMTTLQAAYPIITITGTLTANSTLIVPNQVNEWIFANQTSGAYTLTVKTAAGTGVIITAGSSQYTWSDATNVYFANASAVTSFNTRTGAIVLNSTDVTTALGFTPYNATNPAGYITLAIGNSNYYPLVANPASYITTTVGNAAYYPLASNPAGYVTASTVGGVTSFNTRAGNVTLTSADVTNALTFTPYNATNPNGYTQNSLFAGTGISVSASTGISTISSTGVNTFNTRTGTVVLNATDVTTALGYVPYHITDFPSSLATNGYQKLPSGMIIQWGTSNVTGGGISAAVTFPIAFPTACVSVQVTEADAGSGLWAAGSVTVHGASSISTTGFTSYAMIWNGSIWTSGGAIASKYIAIGY